MIDEKVRAATEQQILAQAPSLGALVEQFRSHISPVLIGGPGWAGLLERARALPVSLGAFGFGFELPLHEREPRADLGVALFEGSRSASRFLEWCRSNGADSSTAAVVQLLHDLGREGSDLRRIVGNRLVLEYDLDPAHCGPPPDPGLFLYITARDLPDEGSVRQRLEDLLVVTDAVTAASGWEPDAEERAQIERVCRATTPDTPLEAVGTFPSRDRAIRLSAPGFRTTVAARGYLERIGWPGSHRLVASTLSHFEARGAFSRIGVHFDASARGVGPRLGLSLHPSEQEWLKDIGHWMPLVEGIRELGLAVPEKLSALTDTATGTDLLLGKSGPLMLMRGIHHIKLTVVGDRIDQVKAYVFYLLFAVPPHATKAAG